MAGVHETELQKLFTAAPIDGIAPKLDFQQLSSPSILREL